MNNLKAIIKLLVSAGTIVALLIIYRSVPEMGAESLDGLTRFNIAAIVLGIVCGAVFFISLKSEKSSGRALSTADKGTNGLLIAVAIIVLELGAVGQFGGVGMDKNNGTVSASMTGCYVQEASFVNHLRGIDAQMIGTDPSGKERIFLLDRETADQIGEGKQDLTVEYYRMTNRLVSVDK